ncbi:hypothetical protein Tco_1419685 [Tanacetum coccineum]
MNDVYKEQLASFTNASECSISSTTSTGMVEICDGCQAERGNRHSLISQAGLTSKPFQNEDSMNIRAVWESKDDDRLFGARKTVGSPVVQQKWDNSALIAWDLDTMQGMQEAKREIDEQGIWKANYSYMAKIQEVSPEESSSTGQPLEQVQNHDENDVFANVRRHSEQPESINDTYVLEKDDSNVIPDSSNICTNDNQVDQNAAECVDERVALANLIANLL